MLNRNARVLLIACLMPLGATAQNVSGTVGIYSANTPASSISYSYNSPVAMGTSNNIFTFTINMNSGSQLGYFFVTFETWPAAPYSCKVGVQPGAFGPGISFLFDDQGNQMGQMNFNDGTVTERNTKCQLSGGGTNAVQSAPNVWTVTFNMQFLQPYGAPVLLYADAYDQSPNNTGWAVLNSLSFTGINSTSLSTVSVISAQGMSLQDNIQVFSVKLRDAAGGIAMWHGELVFLQGSAWIPGYMSSVSTRCKVGAEMTANLMWVESSAGQYAPLYPIGGGSTQPGPNCTLYPQYSSLVQTSENTMELRFAVSFPSQFTGVLQDHIFAADTLGQQPWDLQSGPHWNWYAWPTNWGAPPALPAYFGTCIATPNCSWTLPAATDAPWGGPGNIVPYWIDSTVTATAPGVSITGATGAALQRDPQSINLPGHYPGASPLMRIAASATDFSMSNMTFLGNRWAIGPSGNSQALGAYNTNQALTPGGSVQSDLEVDGNGANISNNYFYDAPGRGVVVTGSSSGGGSNITISGGVANNSNQTGILVAGANSLSPPCTTQSAYIAPGVTTQITVSGVTLDSSSGGPIVVSSGYFINLIGNIITDHQLEPPSGTFESAGGGIVVSFCTANVQITGNSIDDRNVGTPGASGMELDGINMQIENNQITNTPADGISATSTCGTSMYGGVVSKANTAQSGAPYGTNEAQTGGIGIYTQADQVPGRTTEEMLIWGLTSNNSFAALYFYTDGGAPIPFSNVAAQNSCLTPNSNPSNTPSSVMVAPSSCPQPATQPTSSMPAQTTCSAFH